jgi:hypothetical protein
VEHQKEGLMRRRRITLLVLVGLVVGISIPALAVTQYSSRVTYWGPSLVGGNYWCGKVQAQISDGGDYPPNGAAGSWSYAYYGANCFNTHNVGAGYLGAQVHLVKSGGTLCGSTPWSWNGGSSYYHSSFKALSPSGSCPANASYRSEAHAQHWNPNTNQYVNSSWVNSPYIPF